MTLILAAWTHDVVVMSGDTLITVMTSDATGTRQSYTHESKVFLKDGCEGVVIGPFGNGPGNVHVPEAIDQIPRKPQAVSIDDAANDFANALLARCPAGSLVNMGALVAGLDFSRGSPLREVSFSQTASSISIVAQSGMLTQIIARGAPLPTGTNMDCPSTVGEIVSKHLELQRICANAHPQAVGPPYHVVALSRS